MVHFTSYQFPLSLQIIICLERFQYPLLPHKFRHNRNSSYTATFQRAERTDKHWKHMFKHRPRFLTQSPWATANLQNPWNYNTDLKYLPSKEVTIQNLFFNRVNFEILYSRLQAYVLLKENLVMWVYKRNSSNFQTCLNWFTIIHWYRYENITYLTTVSIFQKSM